MAYLITAEDYNLIQLKSHKRYVRIDLLNSKYQVVDSLESDIFDGSITIDATSDLRRSCTLSVVIKDKNFDIDEGGRIWLDKRIQIYIGEENPRTKDIVWWNMGIFIINNPERVYNSQTNTLTINGLDLMSLLTGDRNGYIPDMTVVVPINSNITQAIQDTIFQMGKIGKYALDNIGQVTPYELKFESGTTVYEIISQLRDLYYTWQIYFDIDGTFRFNRIPNGLDDSVVFDFTQLTTGLITSISSTTDFSNIKNSVKVYGRVLEDGSQVESELQDKDPNSPFRIEGTIGEIWLPLIQDDNIINQEQCDDRCKYELILHSRFNDSINIQCIPIPFLDVNQKIRVENPDGKIEDYLIQTINIPLSVDQQMSMECIKVYAEIK